MQKRMDTDVALSLDLYKVLFACLALAFISVAPVFAQTSDTASNQNDAVAPVTKHLPQWELGMGVSAVRMPDYRGSDEATTYALPIPYFIYRGEKLRVDREGVRGRLIDSDRIDLDLSLAASVPVSSTSNKARQGMPNLDASLEAGPSLEINLWRTASREQKLDLRLPLRAAFTVGPHSSPRAIGYLFTPRLNFDLKNVAGYKGAEFGAYVGLLFGSAQNHDYFYSVPAAYATADRPTYQAKGGYAGAQFVAGMSRRFDKWWAGAFVRYDSLNGAVFADSPLVKSRSNFSVGFGVSYIFAQSDTLVRVAD